MGLIIDEYIYTYVKMYSSTWSIGQLQFLEWLLLLLVFIVLECNTGLLTCTGLVWLGCNTFPEYQPSDGAKDGCRSSGRLRESGAIPFCRLDMVTRQSRRHRLPGQSICSLCSYCSLLLTNGNSHPTSRCDGNSFCGLHLLSFGVPLSIWTDLPRWMVVGASLVLQVLLQLHKTIFL